MELQKNNFTASAMLRRFSADQAEHCDRDSIAMVTGSMVNDIHHFLSDQKNPSQTPDQSPVATLSSEAKDALKKVNPNNIILASHSLGSLTAIDMLTGEGLFLALNCKISLLFPE